VPSRRGGLLPLLYSAVPSRRRELLLSLFYSAVSSRRRESPPLFYLVVPSRRREVTLYFLFHTIGHLMCCLAWHACKTFFLSLALKRDEWSEEALGFACGTERKR